MKVKELHSWNLSPSQAIELQKILASKIRFIPIRKKIKLICGLDCAFSKSGKTIIAVAVTLNYPDLETIETVHAALDVTMPYIPGLLSFREAPVCIEAVRNLKNTPDLFLIDGQGIAHPRRLGLASHLGLFFNKPTIGCAKSRLTGDFVAPAATKGAHSPLYAKGAQIGSVVTTRTNVKPLYISPGHLCTMADAIQWTLNCTTKYRLPEPTRCAHITVTKLKSTIH